MPERSPAAGRYGGRYRIASARLATRDYGAPGWYFVTACTRHRSAFFGHVEHGEMYCSPLGTLAHDHLALLPAHYAHVETAAFVVMPNHVHALIGIGTTDDGTGTDAVETRLGASLPGTTPAHARLGDDPRAPSTGDEPLPNDATRRFGGLRGGSLPSIVNQYKGGVTRAARHLGRPDFGWQPRFHDHVVRDERAFHHIRAYILENPLRWSTDRYHTGAGAPRP